VYDVCKAANPRIQVLRAYAPKTVSPMNDPFRFRIPIRCPMGDDDRPRRKQNGISLVVCSLGCRRQLPSIARMVAAGPAVSDHDHRCEKRFADHLMITGMI
jgi:hypothetical protein